MNDYLVFYRTTTSQSDIVVGMARNWPRAERMAENLFLDLKSRKIDISMTGVKRVEHGKLYKDEECSLRWSVVPPEKESSGASD